MSEAGAGEGEVLCGVCGVEVPLAEGVACAACSSPHHPDCWDFNQGCAVFGCGGAARVAFAERAALVRTQGLTITEATPRPPLRLAPVLEGLRRRFWSRLPFLRRTVPAGVGGAALALGACFLIRADPIRHEEVVAGMLLAGLGYGAVAPFLAPTQVRYPRLLAGVCLALGVGSFALIDAFHLRGPLALPLFVLVFVGALLFASSVAEMVAGVRTRVGETLGAWGAWARAGVATLGVAFAVVLLACVEDGRWAVDGEVLVTALAMGLMGGAVAVPAMEQGKQAFLEAIEPKREALSD